ncbi:Peptidyl-prolyl cis-trans isomerase CYP21-1, partial [Mucuna pruriens]
MGIEAMPRAISFLVQPRCLVLFLVLSILLILAISGSKWVCLFSLFTICVVDLIQIIELISTKLFDLSINPAREKEVQPEITDRVFLDVDIDGQRLGRIVIGLYGQVVPKTVGEKGKSANDVKLHYKGTPFHRIVSGFMIQGGDIVHHDGRGYESIYGGTFPDENFKIKHLHAGVVSMVNSGPDSNGSQLDGEHVVFGKVVQGMDTVFAMEGGAGTYNGKPRKKVVIADSGEWRDTQEPAG